MGGWDGVEWVGRNAADAVAGQAPSATGKRGRIQGRTCKLYTKTTQDTRAAVVYVRTVGRGRSGGGGYPGAGGGVWWKLVNFAWSLGPNRWGLTWRCSGVGPSSTSAGCRLALLVGGVSNQSRRALSLPCPSVRRLLLELVVLAGGGVVVVVSTGGLAWWWCCGVWFARRRSGSPWWRVQVCHATSHGQVHLLTGQDRWHWLHQVFRSSRSWRNACRVHDTWYGHLGHRTSITLGSCL